MTKTRLAHDLRLERTFSSAPCFFGAVLHRDLTATLSCYRRCIVAVPERETTEDGSVLVEGIAPANKLERDDNSKIKLSGIKLSRALAQMLAYELPSKLACVDTFSYISHDYVDAVNAVDTQEAFTVEAADNGHGSVALKYNSGKPLMRLVPLSNVVRKTSNMSDDLILKDTHHLSDKGMNYLH